MSKIIVVGLDGSDYSKAALRLANYRAKHYDGEVIGVAVLDRETIEKYEKGAPAGAIHYAEKAVEHLLKDASQKLDKYVDEFEAACKSDGVKYKVVHANGKPDESLIEEGKTADLIVVGLRTFYHFETSTKSGETLKRLLQASVCPVFAVPKDYETPQNAIIAYDGSPQSAKAMRKYVTLSQNLPFTKRIILVYANDKPLNEEQDAMLKRAENYINAYGMEVERNVQKGNPNEVIYKVAKDKAPSIVIMGAYGHNGLGELFFGSTARRVIDDGTIPLFVYH